MCYGLETHRKSKTDRNKKTCIERDKKNMYRQTKSYTESPIMNKTEDR